MGYTLWMAEQLSITPKKQLSKWTRNDRGRKISDDGKTLHEILRKLDPEIEYACLPTDWLAALMDGDEKFIRQLACDAARDPYRFTERKDYRMKSSVIWRGEKGDDLLISKGFISRRSRRTKAHRSHDILDSIIDASIELGVKKYPDLQLLRWKDILAHPATPLGVKESLDPFRIELPSGRHVIPDGRPFVLRHQQQGMIAFFKETDRDTEDLGGSARITIDKKLEAWREVFERKIYDKKYGFPRAMLLFITIDAEREQRIQERIQKIMGGPCKYILTMTADDFEHCYLSVKPHTLIIDNPWHRVGYPNFSLTTLSEV